VYDPIKKRLLTACEQYVRDRVSHAQQAIASASDAAASDTKSSAGDKFETTREMMQQEISRLQQTLADAQQMAHTLAQLDIRGQAGPARLGSLVDTNRGAFFLAIGVGRLVVDGKAYGVVSPASPIGRQLLGKVVGERFTFHSQEYTVEQIR